MTRVANFSSSSIYKLLPPKRGNEPFLAVGRTYIQEKIWEARSGLPIDSEATALPMSWGNLMERYLFKYILGPEYADTNNIERFYHKDIEHWSGVPDSIKQLEQKVVEIKCPWTRRSFFACVDAAEKGWEAFKEAKPEWAWQLVSNSELTGFNTVEFIVFMPYRNQLEDIKTEMDGEPEFYGLSFKTEEELPHILEGGYYKSMNVFTFEIPEEDRELLRGQVKLASDELKKHLHESKD